MVQLSIYISVLLVVKGGTRAFRSNGLKDTNTANAAPELDGLLRPDEITAVSVWIVERHPAVACKQK